jgi:imidazole glycerol phosphate synthase glutamine amidotransferase subunit
MITVIDYGAGNLRSVENALRHLQASFAITSQPADVDVADAILLPGVGHFGQMMRSLDLLEITPVLRRAIRRGVPYLGICLGMHALFERSEEAPSCPGLGMLPGAVRRFPEGSAGLKVPHMGWNRLDIVPATRLFDDIPSGQFVYFAHSYYVPADATEESGWAALSEYGRPFVAAVERDNLWGTQFHPEKSGDAGLRILANFIHASGKSGAYS